MSDLHRRDFLTGAAALAAATATLGAAGRAAAGDPSFMNNVPDPLLTGENLPTFKFALEASRGREEDGSSAREATVNELPISKGLAGVTMRLAPGAMRELHWHATAAEWAYVVSGRVRTTVFDPHGRAEANDFNPGDIWYFPRGHGHMLECLGDAPCHFILVFDNGYFSEFGTFSITDWIGHVPRALLAKNFNVPAATFEGFPTREVYFARGALPPAVPAAPLQGVRPPPQTHRFPLTSSAPTGVFRGGRLWLADAQRFPVSKTVTGAVFEIDRGGMRELHWHPNADEWQYVLAGRASVTLFGSKGRFRTETLGQGDVGYIPQGYGHSIENVADTPLRILIALNAGTYESIELAQWMAGNPVDVLATNFNRPAATFRTSPPGRRSWSGSGGGYFTPLPCRALRNSSPGSQVGNPGASAASRATSKANRINTG
jgi:oxalate decarboxylase